MLDNRDLFCSTQFHSVLFPISNANRICEVQITVELCFDTQGETGKQGPVGVAGPQGIQVRRVSFQTISLGDSVFLLLHCVDINTMITV